MLGSHMGQWDKTDENACLVGFNGNGQGREEKTIDKIR